MRVRLLKPNGQEESIIIGRYDNDLCIPSFPNHGRPHVHVPHIHVQRLRARLQDREASLKAQEKKIQQQGAEIDRLKRELRGCQPGLRRQEV